MIKQYFFVFALILTANTCGLQLWELFSGVKLLLGIVCTRYPGKALAPEPPAAEVLIRGR